MRSSVLELLRSRVGTYISGEEIAKQLNVSRTAIWKHIRELKQVGYEISSHGKSGYCLLGTPDLLLPSEVRSVLKSEIIGRDVKHLYDTNSTNNEAKKLAAEGAIEGTIVLSEAQSDGRGRLARGFFSPPSKGIWLSVILRPAFAPQHAAKCTLMAAVAVTKAIEKVTKVRCGIKWPNDIFFEGKKVVGILTEMSAEMDAINYVVIGIGINVNIAQPEFPQELQSIATSLQAVTGKRVDRKELLSQVLMEIETCYQEAVKNGFQGILQEWKEYSITLGQAVNVIGIDRTFSGRAMDIDEDGALLVETKAGVERVLAGDVSIRPKT